MRPETEFRFLPFLSSLTKDANTRALVHSFVSNFLVTLRECSATFNTVACVYIYLYVYVYVCMYVYVRAYIEFRGMCAKKNKVILSGF